MCVAILGLSLQPVGAEASQGTYPYHNFTDEAAVQQFMEQMEAAGVSKDTTAALKTYIERYNEENTGHEPVVSEWTEAKLGEDPVEFLTFVAQEEFEQK